MNRHQLLLPLSLLLLISGCAAHNNAAYYNALLVRQQLQQQQLAAQRAALTPPDKIALPKRVPGNRGTYFSPYNSDGSIAPWAQERAPVVDNGSDVAAGIGSVAGQHAANHALGFVPFGLGGVIGRAAGESVARSATRTSVAAALPTMDEIRAGSNVSFNTVDDLAVYVYAKSAAHPDSERQRIFRLIMTVYPDFAAAYAPAIARASAKKPTRAELAAKEKAVKAQEKAARAEAAAQEKAARAEARAQEKAARAEAKAQEKAARTASLAHQAAEVQPGIPPAEKIKAPRPIAGTGGQYMCPYTADGSVATWAQERAPETDNGSELAASVGSAAGQRVASHALGFVPFGLGSVVGRSAGEALARSATRKTVAPGLPTMEEVRASSNISFRSVEDLAVYMYAKYSETPEYTRVLSLAKLIYPELEQAYLPAIEKASHQTKKRKK